MEIGNLELVDNEKPNLNIMELRRKGFHPLEFKKLNSTLSSLQWPNMQWNDYRFGICEFDDSVPSEWVNVSSGTYHGNFITFPLHNFNYILRYENGDLQLGCQFS